MAAALRSNVLQYIENVTAWTALNRLKLNPDKTEFMSCATSRMQHHIHRSPFVVGTALIELQTKVQLLGVVLDSDLSMKSHVSRTISTCFTSYAVSSRFVVPSRLKPPSRW